jgi:hypothetical protein
MLAGLIPALRRNIPIMALALATAAAIFVMLSNTVALIAQPHRGSYISTPEMIPGISICEYLPSGDISSCTVQN